MPSYDMASLFWLADLVVETVEPEYKKLQWHEEGDVEVIVCYKGNAKPGDRLPVAIHTYSRTFRFLGVQKVNIKEDGSRVVEPVPERKLTAARTLMFLTWNKKSERYFITANGLICESEGDGAIYGFQQTINPGRYAPVPAEPRYVQLPKGEAFTWKFVLKELAKAMEHANAFETAWRKKDLKELLPYLKAPWQMPEYWGGMEYQFSQEVAKWIVREHKDALQTALAVTEQPRGCIYAKHLLTSELKKD